MIFIYDFYPVASYREITTDSRFREGRQGQFIVGLSGNLGFTQRRLRDHINIHFLLSGWGVGCAALVIHQENIVWLVPPEALADVLRHAAADRAGIVEKGGASAAAAKYSPEVAFARYRDVILQAGRDDLTS